MDKTKEFHRFIVVGTDAFALSIFSDLSREYGENAKLIATRKIEKEDLQIIGPSGLRGNHHFEGTPFAEGLKARLSVFYKELRFREFKGRSKSEKLLWGEEFYTQAGASVSEKEIVPEIFKEDFLKRVNLSRLDQTIVGIRKTTRDNLIENANWNLTVASGQIIQCEHLIWAKGPKSFLDLYTHKNDLSNEYIEFCEQINPHCELGIRFRFDKPLTEDDRTLFLPLSYTHDWGHFVGEFKEDELGSYADFITFIDKNQTSEEDISKKIKILKKYLKKIFPKFSSIYCDEFISLNENPGCLKIDDELFFKVKNETKNLHFAGYNGPLAACAKDCESFEDSARGVSHLSRALLVKESLKTNLLNL